jgi:apolipoprotein N-acyltransferase
VPFRASENGLGIVRATRGGRSLIVDPHGRLLARADDGAGDVVLVARLPLPEQSGGTLYWRLGNWPAVLAIGLLALVVLRARRLRSRSSPA